MLVLSRRTRERIVFPHLQISVEVLKIAGNAVRLGVEAPDDVAVLRGELSQHGEVIVPSDRRCGDPASSAELARKEHKIRNRLQSVLLRIHLLNRQLGAEAPPDVAHSARELLEELQSLDEAIGALCGAAGAIDARQGKASALNNTAARRGSQPEQADLPLLRGAPVERTVPSRAPLASRLAAGRLANGGRASAAATPSGGEGAAPRMHALLVEDNANESSLLASYLSQQGIDVMTAEDGAVALDLLSSQARPPDVVLLDMMMPRVDGPATVRAIRCNPEFQGMRIYAVTGSAPHSLGVPTGPCGVDAWFQKPLNPQRLVQEMVAGCTISSAEAAIGSFI